MHLSINKVASTITMVLLLSSFILIELSIQPVQAQGTVDVTQLPHGGSPDSGVSGMPNLGPLPAGAAAATRAEEPQP